MQPPHIVGFMVSMHYILVASHAAIEVHKAGLYTGAESRLNDRYSVA